MSPEGWPKAVARGPCTSPLLSVTFYCKSTHVIQHWRKTLHSRTRENRLVIQIQKALWRKLEPLFSRNKKALRFKRGQRKCACIRGQILPTRNNNHSKSICVSWPLSVKHAAKITFAQWKCRTFQSIIYPAEEKNFIGTSSILAWGKSRVGFPFIAPILSTFTLLRHFRHHLLRCTANESAISKP